jgi:hypothetical protein
MTSLLASSPPHAVVKKPAAKLASRTRRCHAIEATPVSTLRFTIRPFRAPRARSAWRASV